MNLGERPSLLRYDPASNSRHSTLLRRRPVNLGGALLLSFIRPCGSPRPRAGDITICMMYPTIQLLCALSHVLLYASASWGNLCSHGNQSRASNKCYGIRSNQPHLIIPKATSPTRQEEYEVFIGCNIPTEVHNFIYTRQLMFIQWKDAKELREEKRPMRRIEKRRAKK